MVLHLCLPDSCEENENSSSHCVKLLIIDSSLEICKLRCCTYLYRRLVGVKGEVFKRAPFPLLIFKGRGYSGVQGCVFPWLQRAKTNSGIDCNFSYSCRIQLLILQLLIQCGLFRSCIGTCQNRLRNSVSAANVAAELLRDGRGQSRVTGGYSLPPGVAVPSCCSPVGFPEGRETGAELLLWRGTPAGKQAASKRKVFLQLEASKMLAGMQG